MSGPDPFVAFSPDDQVDLLMNLLKMTLIHVHQAGDETLEGIVRNEIAFIEALREKKPKLTLGGGG